VVEVRDTTANPAALVVALAALSVPREVEKLIVLLGYGNLVAKLISVAVITAVVGWALDGAFFW